MFKEHSQQSAIKLKNNGYIVENDQYISRYLGFIDISVSAKMANFIGLSRS